MDCTFDLVAKRNCRRSKKEEEDDGLECTLVCGLDCTFDLVAKKFLELEWTSPSTRPGSLAWTW